jgi:hypothetical protein
MAAEVLEMLFTARLVGVLQVTIEEVVIEILSTAAGGCVPSALSFLQQKKILLV